MEEGESGGAREGALEKSSNILVSKSARRSWSSGVGVGVWVGGWVWVVSSVCGALVVNWISLLTDLIKAESLPHAKSEMICGGSDDIVN